MSRSKMKFEFKNKFCPILNFATNKNNQIINAHAHIRLVAISALQWKGASLLTFNLKKEIILAQTVLYAKSHRLAHSISCRVHHIRVRS